MYGKQLSQSCFCLFFNMSIYLNCLIDAMNVNVFLFFVVVFFFLWESKKNIISALSLCVFLFVLCLCVFFLVKKNLNWRNAKDMFSLGMRYTGISL